MYLINFWIENVPLFLFLLFGFFVVFILWCIEDVFLLLAEFVFKILKKRIEKCTTKIN